MSDANTKKNQLLRALIASVVDSNGYLVPDGGNTRVDAKFVIVTGTAAFDQEVELSGGGEVPETILTDMKYRWSTTIHKAKTGKNGPITLGVCTSLGDDEPHTYTFTFV